MSEQLSPEQQAAMEAFEQQYTQFQEDKQKPSILPMAYAMAHRAGLLFQESAGVNYDEQGFTYTVDQRTEE